MARFGAGSSRGTASPFWRAVLSRSSPVPNCPATPMTHRRAVEAAVNGVLVASLYAPNGNPQPGPKFKYKLAWMDRLAAHAAELYAAGVPVVLAGDYNVVPSDRDIYPKNSYVKDALLQPEARMRFAHLLDQGWRDAIRSFNPDTSMYTYWSYLRNRWPRDAGLRIDFLLLAEERSKAVGRCGRRSCGSRRRKCQRSCADLGRIA